MDRRDFNKGLIGAAVLATTGLAVAEEPPIKAVDIKLICKNIEDVSKEIFNRFLVQKFWTYLGNEHESITGITFTSVIAGPFMGKSDRNYAVWTLKVNPKDYRIKKLVDKEVCHDFVINNLFVPNEQRDIANLKVYFLDDRYKSHLIHDTPSRRYERA